MTEGQSAKTVKELVLEHDEKLDAIRSELDKAKGALWLAVALGLVNALDTIQQFFAATHAVGMVVLK